MNPLDWFSPNRRPLSRKRRGARPPNRQGTRLTIEPLEERTLLNYSITDLGTLGGTISNAYAISNRGQIAGASEIDCNCASHPFLGQKERARAYSVENLVPKLGLGTGLPETLFPEIGKTNAKRSFRRVRSQTEFGNEEKSPRRPPLASWGPGCRPVSADKRVPSPGIDRGGRAET